LNSGSRYFLRAEAESFFGTLMLRVQWDSSRPASPCFPAQADAGRAITEDEHND
jgi:hypothetical protein